MSGGAGSTGDDERARRRAAVERELERRRARSPGEDADERDDDLVDTVGAEQRREREAMEDDEDA